MMELLQDTNIWFTFSFIIFAAIIIKFGFPVLNKALDDRIDGIKLELETSERLRVEAQEMLAQYQRKHKSSVQESAQIIKVAQENASKFKAQAEEDLEEIMARREAMLADRLKRMEKNAIAEIQSFAANLAMKATAQIVVDKLDKKVSTKLIESSIDGVSSNIN